MNIIKRFNKLVFFTEKSSVLKDIRFWLLLVGLNTGANLGFNYNFPIMETLIALFFMLCLMFLRHKKRLTRNMVLYISFFIFIFIIQAAYLPIYSVNTTIHYVLMITVALMLVSLCGKDFPSYFSGIIFIYAVISLFCFFYILLGGSIPYYPIQESNIDGGVIMRVYNFYYTQLGNPGGGLIYNARNCGPFWEPGAFQGFLNLSLWFELTLNRNRDLYWKIRVIVFIVTVLTTLSTGGYIVLFTILLFYFLQDRKKGSAWRIAGTAILLIISIYAYSTLDFLGDKIVSDESRKNFSFTNFPNPLYAIAGYGYATEMFRQSSMSSASSVFNLFRYMGILGFLGYMLPLFFNRTYYKISFFIIVSLILMNEPFLSNALIWWGMPFVFYDVFNKNKKVISKI